MPTVDELQRWLQAETLPHISAKLPSGRTVDIPRFLRREVRAVESVPRNTSCWAPNKPALDFDGVSTWAEFVTVRLLERSGWSGRWIKNWGGRREFCESAGRPATLAPSAASVLATVDKRAAIRTGGGAWDVFAWRDEKYLFIESKKYRSSDRLRPGQFAWMDAALQSGMSHSSFAVVEYDIARLVEPLSGAARTKESRTRSNQATPARTVARHARAASDQWMASPLGPPPATGPCGFLTSHSRPCENEGRYDRDGVLSCSRHMKARNPMPWDLRTP